MNNNTPLTCSEALKLYSGKSISKMILFITGFALGLYLFIVLYVLLMNGLDNGSANSDDMLATIMAIVSNIFLALEGGIITTLLSQMTYEKENPGGKLFRSVKGGYDTYIKMRVGNLITAIVVIFLFLGIICAINAVFPILMYGTATCISMLFFLLLNIGICTLLSMIPNGAIRGGISVIVSDIIGLIGIMSVLITSGRLGWIQIAAGAAAIVLIPISFKLMINNYKEKRWNS